MSRRVYKDLKQGLEDAIKYEQGRGKAKTAVYSIDPVETFSREKIRQIRINSGLTQKLMAEFMGVSIKTIEAWEKGTNHPTGPAKRLLHILETEKLNTINFVNPKVKDNL